MGHTLDNWGDYSFCKPPIYCYCILMQEETYIMVFTTCASAEKAGEMAEALVTQKLAACVNIVDNMRSVYQWQGKVEHSTETLLMIKTRQVLFDIVQKAIQEIHVYELPEIIAVPIESGEANYLNWLGAATRK